MVDKARIAELETELRELKEWKRKDEISKAVAIGIKIRCAAVWSFMLGSATITGTWIANHYAPVEAGFRAFWAALRGGQ